MGAGGWVLGMTTCDFNSRFKELTGHTPFGWQRRLFEKYFLPFDKDLAQNDANKDKKAKTKTKAA